MNWTAISDRGIFRAAPVALCVAVIIWGWSVNPALADEPPLPLGLQEAEPALPTGLEPAARSEEPALPPGLSPAPSSEEPPLPLGLEGSTESTLQEKKSEGSFRDRLPFLLNGFWEARGGVRTQEDRHEKDASIGETRLQLQGEKSWGRTTLKVTSDFLYDAVMTDREVDLDEGEGFIDLREASLFLRPSDFLDLKFGRQVLTWGTGDLLFINDLFPKDWNAFFIGRDTEYLKAPSDAVKASLFFDVANLDVIYTPRFDADRFIDGRRISFYNEGFGRLSGRDFPVKDDRPDDWFDDDEWAMRLYRNVGTFEVALYGYRGFWKSPGGMDPASGKAIFPDLSVYGASLRGPVLGGIGNLEAGYYDSEDDRDGDDPFVRNGEFRFLAGFEREAGTDLTAAIQYYLEYMLDHDEYRRTLPPGVPEKDKDRHVVTLRLTKLLDNQNLKLSLFGYYSPSDQDAYLRPSVNYKVTDAWTVEAGGNLFLGDEEYTFFGQFEDNSNVYASVRYSF